MIYVNFPVSSLNQYLVDEKIDTIVSVGSVMQRLVDDMTLIDNYCINNGYCKVFCNPEDNVEEGDIEADDLEEEILSLYTRGAVELAKLTVHRNSLTQRIQDYTNLHRDTSAYQEAVARFLKYMHVASILINQSSIMSVHARHMFAKIDYLLSYLDYSTPIQFFSILNTLSETRDLEWKWGSDSNEHVFLVLNFRTERLKKWFPVSST